ncbi:hypothetical protein F5Y12DRAFT_765979 [Xylaria sp. FL1777]|nr:hypothetical protein F5Y12DRAFT_765979 [Xylaria sp. FL1777]
MDQLPLELIQRLLSYLDLTSLRNAALSCRFLFNAFKAAETLITSKILFQQIDPSVLPEAILVNKSWCLGTPSVSKGLEFSESLKHRRPAPTKWGLVDALPLVRFHTKVSYLATRFAHYALEKQPRLLEAGELDHKELCRFERALYRFQLYRNLVGSEYFTDEELGSMFFDYFSTWENEQLVCTYEYLIGLVAKPFNYFVEHDIAWGYLRVRYIDYYESGYAQAILVDGLEKIYDLSQASDYEQLRALLSRGDDRFDEPFELGTFVGITLERALNPMSPQIMSISEMNEDEKEVVIGEPFYKDPDPGPALMWEWMYRDHDPGCMVAYSHFISYRQWAFPFWNASRLRNTGLLGDPNIPGSARYSELELEEYNTADRLKYLEEMRDERTKIYYEGGRGCYYHQDTSQVKWPAGHPRIRFAQPQSLEEAKALLKSYT